MGDLPTHFFMNHSIATAQQHYRCFSIHILLIACCDVTNRSAHRPIDAITTGALFMLEGVNSRSLVNPKESPQTVICRIAKK